MRELPQGVFEQGHSAAEVPFLEMSPSNRGLNQPLQDQSILSPGIPPKVFPDLMSLYVSPSIETSSASLNRVLEGSGLTGESPGFSSLLV